MTETVLDQLPNRHGYEEAITWIGEISGYTNEDETHFRLLIAGVTGTGKTRALIDAAEVHKHKLTAYQYRRQLYSYNPTCFIMNAIQFQRWTKSDTNCNDEPLNAFISGGCDRCGGQGCDAFSFVPHVFNDDFCIECIFIDDLQEFTNKTALSYLKYVFENYNVMFTLQIPEGVGDFKKWLLNRFSGQYGNNQVEAEAVIRRMGEEGLAIIRMHRDDETNKNAEG